MWIRMMSICFLTNGLAVFGLKIMSALGFSETYKLSYLIGWYGCGLLLAALVFFAKQGRLYRRELLIGGGLALSSVFGQLGMAYSLDHGIPGYVVFQVAPGGGLFLVVVVGIVFFSERVTWYGLAGISLGMIALAMLAFG